jgi:hypothetical protein
MIVLVIDPAPKAGLYFGYPSQLTPFAVTYKTALSPNRRSNLGTKRRILSSSRIISCRVSRC